MDGESKFIAWVSTLLHDIGRYEQFKRYKTFLDRHSVNHIGLAIEILTKENILESLENELQTLILAVIANHNNLSIPDNLHDIEQYFTKLLRYADKLDIFRIMVEHYEDASNNHAVVWGLPNNESYSDDVSNKHLTL